MPGSSARQLSLALALSAVLAGCTGDGDKPQTLPTIKSPSPAASPSPPMTTAAPTSDMSARGVEAFIRSYYAEINRAIETGDVKALTSYSIPACPCRRLVASIMAKSAGSSIRGGHFTIHVVSPHDVMPTLAGAQVLYDVEEAKVVKPDGTVVQTVKAESGARDDLSLVRSNGKWLVANVFLLN